MRRLFSCVMLTAGRRPSFVEHGAMTALHDTGGRLRAMVTPLDPRFPRPRRFPSHNAGEEAYDD